MNAPVQLARLRKWTDRAKQLMGNAAPNPAPEPRPASPRPPGSPAERRRADAEQREWLVERLERGKKGLERYARALVDSASLDTDRLDAVAQVDRLRRRVDQLCGRIRGAMHGGGALGATGADDAQREQVYQHDLQLIERVAATADAMESLGDSPGDPDSTLAAIAGHLLELNDAWDVREDLLRE